MALTDVQVRNLKATPKRYIEWEEGRTGFGVRVSPFGKKTFIFMYRFNGKARMMTLGNYPEMDLATARLKKAEAEGKVSKGEEDPGEKQIAAKRAHREAPTIAEFAGEYLEKWAKPHKRSWREDERMLKKDIIPAWGTKKAKAITRRDIIILLDSIVERGAPIAANRTFNIIRKMFTFAVQRDIIPASPCVGIEPPGKENTRDRILSEAEIKTFWESLEKAKMRQGTRLALKLMLVTAQRKGEITGAEWSELDMQNRVWTIPASKAKNGKAHTVPLSPLAIDLLDEIKQAAKDSAWLFPSPRRHQKGGSITTRSASHALLNNLGNLGIEPFTPHDLRRTAASKMTKAGIPRLVVGKILNHVESGVTAIYDRHGYDNEKRQALDLWAHKLEEIITGRKESKVVPMARNGKR